jgi:hypothetical protein
MHVSNVLNLRILACSLPVCIFVEVCGGCWKLQNSILNKKETFLHFLYKKSKDKVVSYLSCGNKKHWACLILSEIWWITTASEWLD